MEKISVLGCGRWGSFIAWYLDRAGHEVTLYGREGSRSLAQFEKDRTNGLITLPERICLSSRLDAFAKQDIIVISIASQSLRAFLQTLPPDSLRDKPFVLCMKGLEIGSGKRLSQVAREELPESAHIAVWLGPGHVQEFYAGVPNCMVINFILPMLLDALLFGVLHIHGIHIQLTNMDMVQHGHSPSLKIMQNLDLVCFNLPISVGSLLIRIWKNCLRKMFQNL